MATAGEKKLTDSVIAELAAAIPVEDMKTVALLKLGFNDTEVKNIKCDTGSSHEFNREILRTWRNRNAGQNQVKVWESASSTLIHIWPW